MPQLGLLLAVFMPMVASQHQQMDLGALLGGMQGGGRGGGRGGGGRQAGCPPGQVYIPRKEYRPQANGCGPAGMRQRDGDQYMLHECCNGHDTCYVRPSLPSNVFMCAHLICFATLPELPVFRFCQTACGASFDYCEKSFLKCMLKKCKADTVPAGQRQHCEQTANSFSGSESCSNALRQGSVASRPNRA